MLHSTATRYVMIRFRHERSCLADVGYSAELCCAARVMKKDPSHARAVVLRFTEDGDQMWQPVDKVVSWIEVCAAVTLTHSPKLPNALCRHAFCSFFCALQCKSAMAPG